MVDVNGVRLYTRRVGDGPPVVVLHGGPGAHHDYLLPQYDRLAGDGGSRGARGGRALLYYDQRGGGRSPVARDTLVGWREHVADLEALRRHLGTDRLALRSEEHTSELQSHSDLVCRLLLEKKKKPTRPTPRKRD